MRSVSVVCVFLLAFLFLTSCGGGSSSTGPGQFTHVYVVFPPAANDPNYSHFMNTVMNQPAIEGVTVATPWRQAETSSPGLGTCTPVGTDTCQLDAYGWTHSYDWSSIDSANSGWFKAQSGSKKMNLVLVGIGGVSTNCLLDNSCFNSLTPKYVSTSNWAAHTASSNIDLINANKDGCSNYLGAIASSMTRSSSGLVTVTEPNHGYSNGDTIWVGGTTPSDFNIAGQLGVTVQNVTSTTFQYQTAVTTAGSATTPGTTVSGQQSYPVPYEAPYKAGWEAFVAAAILHYNASPNLSQISYMRVGRSVGGEAFPLCQQTMEQLSAPNTYTRSEWLQYYTDIDQFVQSQNPEMQILDPLNGAGSGSTVDPSYGTDEAQTAVSFKNAAAMTNGIGSQGLQASDLTNYAAGNSCSSDWCGTFNTYEKIGIPLELQQLGLSAPVQISGANTATGDLRPLLPFAIQRHATIVELYYLDALLAYDPNYCMLPAVGGLCGPGSVQIPIIALPPQDQLPYFQAVGQPGQSGATGDGSYATVINGTEGQH
jgi:hypothetical protein